MSSGNLATDNMSLFLANSGEQILDPNFVNNNSWDFVGVPEFDDIFGTSSPTTESPSSNTLSPSYTSNSSNPSSPNTLPPQQIQQLPPQPYMSALNSLAVGVNNNYGAIANPNYLTVNRTANTPVSYVDMHIPLQSPLATSAPLQHNNPPDLQNINNPSIPKKSKRPHEEIVLGLGEETWEHYFPPNREVFPLYDQYQRELSGTFDFLVQKIDKNVQYSDQDKAWIMYRQNRFQVDCELVGSLKSYNCLGHLEGSNNKASHLLYVDSNGLLSEVHSLYFEIYAVKVQASPDAPMESRDPTTYIPVHAEERVPLHQVGASRAKRDNRLPEPCAVQMGRAGWSKLQFSAATGNNARLHPSLPNPAQQYFRIVVCLLARSRTSVVHLLFSKISPPLIVRGQNPGRFMSGNKIKDELTAEPEVEPIQASISQWVQSSTDPGIVYHVGKVGVNTSHPSEALTVGGNILVTGEMMKPSDRRLKSNFSHVEPEESLNRLTKLKVYDYDRAPLLGEEGEGHRERGIIAQELQEVMPNAVKVIGEIKLKNGQTIPQALVVNDRVLLFETINATQKLAADQEEQKGAISKISHRLSVMAKESQRHRDLMMGKLQHIVDYMANENAQYPSDDQSSHTSSQISSIDGKDYSVHFSVCGLGSVWTLFLLGFFLPILWVLGAMMIFSRSKRRRVAGFANFILLALMSAVIGAVFVDADPLIPRSNIVMIFIGALWGTGFVLFLVLITVRRSQRIKRRDSLIQRLSKQGFRIKIPRVAEGELPEFLPDQPDQPEEQLKEYP